MKKKGFTVIELLVIIVLLSIILTLVFSNVTKFYNQSKKNTFITSVSGMILSLKGKYAQYDNANISFQDLEYSGKQYQYGTVYVNDEDEANIEFNIAVFDPETNYCVYKNPSVEGPTLIENSNRNSCLLLATSTTLAGIQANDRILVQLNPEVRKWFRVISYDYLTNNVTAIAERNIVGDYTIFYDSNELNTSLESAEETLKFYTDSWIYTKSISGRVGEFEYANTNQARLPILSELLMITGILDAENARECLNENYGVMYSNSYNCFADYYYIPNWHWLYQQYEGNLEFWIATKARQSSYRNQFVYEFSPYYYGSGSETLYPQFKYVIPNPYTTSSSLFTHYNQYSSLRPVITIDTNRIVTVGDPNDFNTIGETYNFIR